MSFSQGIKKPVRNRLIDIDGTICTDIDNEDSHLYPYAQVFDGAVDKINKFYSNGDFIVFFTAREEKDRQVTEDWLQLHGFKYHYLLMGKPRGGNYWWLDNLQGEFQLFTGNWKDVEE